MAREVGEAIRVRREVWRHQTGMEWPWLLDRVKAVFTPRVDAENLAEMAAAEAAKR